MKAFYMILKVVDQLHRDQSSSEQREGKNFQVALNCYIQSWKVGLYSSWVSIV